MTSLPGDPARQPLAARPTACIAPAVALLAALLLSGCGQKGPLYLPSTQKKPVPAGASPAAQPSPGAPAAPSSQPSSNTPQSTPPAPAAPNNS